MSLLVWLLIIVGTSVGPSPVVPPHLLHRLRWLSDSARLMGIYLLAGKGSGKSRLMGRVIGWQDFLRGFPVIILDPNGPTISNLLDKLTRLPREYQEKLWKRVRYVDMSSSRGFVTPWPLYYRIGNESLYQISQRYLEAIRRVDPWLQSAPIQGWNSLSRLATYVGMVLAALGLQITEAESLLTDPDAWSQRFSEAVNRFPEVAPAVAFFTEQYTRWSRGERESRSDSLRTKIAQLTLEPMTRAMFGASVPGIDWVEVVEERQAVLLDFSKVLSFELRRFLMLWVFLGLIDFIKSRGAGRHRPVSLIVDELTALYNLESKGSDIFSTDLDELINVLARNYSVWLTLAHQELFQIDEKARKTLLTMGTHILGVTSDPEAALRLAQVYYPYDPHKVKRYEPVYSNRDGVADVIAERPIPYTAEEQHLLASYAFRSLGTFHFLVKTAQGEGDARGALRQMSIANLDRGQWVNEALVKEAQLILMGRNGISIETALSDIQARLAPTHPEPISTIRGYGQSPYPFSIPDNDDETLAEEK